MFTNHYNHQHNRIDCSCLAYLFTSTQLAIWLAATYPQSDITYWLIVQPNDLQVHRSVRWSHKGFKLKKTQNDSEEIFNDQGVSCAMHV